MNSILNERDRDDQIDWFEETRSELDERFRVARRHSALVRILKIALPAVSVLGVAAFVIYVYVLPELPPSIAASSIDITHNAIVMQNPHVSGFMNGGRSYELRADRAEQSLQNTKVVTLQNIGATIGIGDNQSAKVKASSGTYYSDAERIVLSQQITLSTTTGIQGALESADINLKAGTMSSDSPIAFSSQGSTIHANGVEVKDRGQHISFKNGVKVTYAMPAESPTIPKRSATPVTE